MEEKFTNQNKDFRRKTHHSFGRRQTLLGHLLNNTAHNRQNYVNQGTLQNISLSSKIVEIKNDKCRLHKPIGMKGAFKFQIRNNGNNSELIQKMLGERANWIKLKSGQFPIEEINFIWGKWTNQSQNKKNKLFTRQMSSKIQNNKELHDKGKLYTNIVSHCTKNHIKYDEFLPITFLLSENRNFISNFKEFLTLFKYIASNTNLANIWIFKPTNLNQGREICLFNDIKTLLKIFQKYKGPCVGEGTELVNSKFKHQHRNSIQFSNKTIQNNNKVSENEESQLMNVVKEVLRSGKNFIIQKYVQNPLLIEKRKFDIRMWVLVDHQRNYYLFKEGYLRFSSQKYCLTNQSILNNFVHLTNHSLQKYSPNYSDKNLMEMSFLKDWIQKKLNNLKGYQSIQEQIKNIVKISIQATLNKNRSLLAVNQFQIFGFDFLVDRQLKVRLIQANTNPAITEDSVFLSYLIPRMINDAFCLTLDKLFHTRPLKRYPVEGYSLNQNLWQNLGTLKTIKTNI